MPLHAVRRFDPHLSWSDILIRDQQPDLAAQIRRFAEQMPPPMTDRERLAGELVERTRPPRTREGPSSR